MGSIYHINRGINRSIEFKGIRAQYLGYFAIGLLLLFLLFAVLYVLGLGIWICTGIIAVLGIGLYFSVIHLSHRFGRFGLMKFLARKAIPECLVFRSRKMFAGLKGGGDD
jgi:hypothetical protein